MRQEGERREERREEREETGNESEMDVRWEDET